MSWGLDRLVTLLNAARATAGDLPPAARRAARIAEGILTASPTRPAGTSTSPAALAFNLAARTVPFRLVVEQEFRAGRLIRTACGVREPPPTSTAWLAQALWALWRFYFQGEGWQRVKSCRTCRRWYVDWSRNHLRETCSQACKDRYWTRARRRAAGHGRGKRPRRGT